MSTKEPEGHCRLCGRRRPLTFHHLIPRSLHSNKWFKKRYAREELQRGIDICRDCHSAIHRFASEKELGRDWNTVEALLAHEEIGKFVRWLRGRDSAGRIRTR
ncbi:MAG: hypothetical protein RL885_28620 [Planctomycetota bacterium]